MSPDYGVRFFIKSKKITSVFLLNLTYSIELQKTILVMRFIPLTILFFLMSSINTVTVAQSSLKKANKQYELYAFNLAIKSYQKVLERQPKNIEAIGKIADCYRHLNRLEEAEKWYNQLMSLRNIDNIYYLQYGKVLKGLGKYDEAKRLFLKYAEKYPVAGNQYAESCDFAKARMRDKPNTSISNEFANSASSDFGITFFTDERIVYASGRRDIKSSNRGAPSSKNYSNNQLFITTRDDNGFLRKPNLLRNEFSKSSSQGPIAYSPDGKTVIVTKNNFVDGTRQIPGSGLELSLHIGEVQSNGDWNNLTPFPYNGSGYSTGFASFSPDGNSLYFASDRPDGFGGYDIYVSTKVGSSWSAPENVGPVINSQGNEITPFYDGTKLTFASDWHFGFGGFDLFQLNHQHGTRHSAPENLGSGYNSPRDDFGFISDPLTGLGYFISNRVGGKGYEDLYRVTGQSQMENILIIVHDEKSGEPLPNAVIDLSGCGGPEAAHTDATGHFSFFMEADQKCHPQISKNGYISQQINLNTGLSTNIELDVFLSNEEDVFKGEVIGAGNNAGLEDVTIRATNTSNNQRLEVFSDHRGKYALALKPNSNYIIRYSRAGYKDVNRTIRTNDYIETKKLDAIYLPPAGTNIDVEPSGDTGDVSDNRPSSDSGEDNSTTISSGYAVQISALSSSSPDLSEFENKVGSIGQVFSHRESGKSKIRVGIFETRQEADNAKSLLRNKGFSGAFVVTQSTSGQTDKIVKRPSSESKSGSVLDLTNPSTFMVRLGAYKNPKYFDKDKVVEIGIVESYQKGDYTIMLLTGYDSKDMAKRALRKALSRGFKGAYVITEQGGELVKVK